MCPFAIMYDDADGMKIFRPCSSQDEARNMARNIACMGISVTVFDYDAESGAYLEFYTI